MPPHCDALDGPVVKAARISLENNDVVIVLPYVPKEYEQEIIELFAKVSKIRNINPDVKEVVDRLFFETVVRCHRLGEGASFAGLKPAGLDHGPVLSLAEKAIAQGSADALIDFLKEAVSRQMQEKLQEVMMLETGSFANIAEERRYVSAVLGFQVYCNNLYKDLKAGTPHIRRAA